MADKGLVRFIARESFGLAVRLLGLYVGYLSGSSLVNDLFGDTRHASVIASSIIGLVVAVALLRKADGLCHFSYRTMDPDAAGA